MFNQEVVDVARDRIEEERGEKKKRGSEVEKYRKAWREIIGILFAGVIFLVLTVGGDVIGELLQRIQ